MKQRSASLVAQPEFWLGLLLVWLLLSALRSWHTPWARDAGTEALHWASGILLALALGRGLRRTTGAAQALTVLLGGLVAAIVCEGCHADGRLTGPYGDHQLCASALLALLPVALALGLAAATPAWRWGGQIVAVAGALCLALTQTRSAWVGAAAAVLVFASLWLRRPAPSPRTVRRRAWVIPALLAFGVAGAGALLVAGTDLRLPLAARLQTLQSAQSVGQDASWRARVATWRGAAAMAAARPVAGWGLGRYPGAQWAWTHTGRPLTAAQRPSLSEEAHDFYLQTLVETGAVGLGLYLTALAVLAGRCLLALRAPGPRPYGLRQALLVAALSLLTGQGVDALASPAWQFPEVSLLLWAALGLGLAATYAGQADEASALPPAPVRRALHLGAAGLAGVLLAASVVPLGLLTPVEAYTDATGGLNLNTVMLTLNPGSRSVSFSANPQIAFTMTFTYTDNAGTHTADVTADSQSSYLVTATGVFYSAFSGASPNVLILDARDAAANKVLTVRGTAFINGLKRIVYVTITLSP